MTNREYITNNLAREMVRFANSSSCPLWEKCKDSCTGLKYSCVEKLNIWLDMEITNDGDLRWR